MSTIPLIKLFTLSSGFIHFLCDHFVLCTAHYSAVTLLNHVHDTSLCFIDSSASKIYENVWAFTQLPRWSFRPKIRYVTSHGVIMWRHMMSWCQDVIPWCHMSSHHRPCHSVGTRHLSIEFNYYDILLGDLWPWPLTYDLDLQSQRSYGQGQFPYKKLRS